MISVVSGKTKLASVQNENAERPTEKFVRRESKELVLAFSGPIGCGIKTVVTEATATLSSAGYDVVCIKISEFIEEARKHGIHNSKTYPATKAGRYDRLQDLGNAFRERYESGDILAEFAVKRIAEYRTENIPKGETLDDYVPPRRAYLIDQLKHPNEVKLLRSVYRNLFFLVGVLSVTDRRKKRLLEDGLSDTEATAAMGRDRKEPDALGQQLEKTLELADYFIRNDKPNVEQVRNQVERMVGLMHGKSGISPSRQEYGMYLAYAAGLGSACLSRQVGAAIVDRNGNVLSTGCNDVPKAGGGLYTTESGAQDARCIKLEGQKCWNDYHKDLVHQQIRTSLVDQIGTYVANLIAKNQIKGDLADKVAELSKPDHEGIATLARHIFEHSRLKDLTEFSRSIHAEMDAIISVARTGAGRLDHSTLYVTTFPCHSCARHIVTSGIRTVYYIEPYEKSLAVDLHSDALTSDPDETAPGDERVRFVHFEGVAPRQYLAMFKPTGERKKDGVAILRSDGSEKIVPEYLDDYRIFETKVVEHLEKITESVQT